MEKFDFFWSIYVRDLMKKRFWLFKKFTGQQGHMLLNGLEILMYQVFENVMKILLRESFENFREFS